MNNHFVTTTRLWGCAEHTFNTHFQFRSLKYVFKFSFARQEINSPKQIIFITGERTIYCLPLTYFQAPFGMRYTDKTVQLTTHLSPQEVLPALHIGRSFQRSQQPLWIRKYFRLRNFHHQKLSNLHFAGIYKWESESLINRMIIFWRNSLEEFNWTYRLKLKLEN